jgi:hypothetical protein
MIFAQAGAQLCFNRRIFRPTMFHERPRNRLQHMKERHEDLGSAFQQCPDVPDGALSILGIVNG